MNGPIYSPAEMELIIQRLAPDLKVPSAIDALCLLRAFALQESSFGKNNKPRAEKNFGPGGIYYEAKSPGGRLLRELYSIYGHDVSKSWGPFQILYITAVEMGFSKTIKPSELRHGLTSGPFVVKYINSRIARGAKTVAKIADAYNSGTHKDHISERVEQYRHELEEKYDQFVIKHLSIPNLNHQGENTHV